MLEAKNNIKSATPFAQTYFHGTKADLKIGDFIEVGYSTNYQQHKKAKYISIRFLYILAIGNKNNNP